MAVDGRLFFFTVDEEMTGFSYSFFFIYCFKFCFWFRPVLEVVRTGFREPDVGFFWLIGFNLVFGSMLMS